MPFRNPLRGQCQFSVCQPRDSPHGGHGEPDADPHSEGSPGIEPREIHLNDRTETRFAYSDDESTSVCSAKVLDRGKACSRNSPDQGTDCK